MDTLSLLAAESSGQAWPAWRDTVRLAKPRLSLLVFCTTGVGMWTGHGRIGLPLGAVTLLATALLVAAANAYNSYLERFIDARMRRTRARPLPAGKVEPAFAHKLSLALALLASVALYAAAGPLPALLGFVAFGSYAWLYTPMKQVSWTAVFVGAVPGAIPPLLGTAAVEGRIGATGLALFALLFVWQLPHFLAIALKLADDYQKGGIVVLPHVVGPARTQRWLARFALLLVPISVLPSVAGGATWWWGAQAAVSSMAFFWLCDLGAGRPRFYERIFLASVCHMALLLLTLFVDGALSR